MVRDICNQCSDSGRAQKSTVAFWIPYYEKDTVPLVRPSAIEPE